MGILSRRFDTLAVLLSASILFAPMGAGSGEAVEEYRLKAAFLYNFAKFVSWPANLTEGLSSLQVCVAGSSEARDAVMASLTGKSAIGLPIEVRGLEGQAAAARCQLVFSTRDAGSQASQLSQSVSGRPVLLVGESPGFARKGGMIGFVEENSKLRFEVNLAEVEKAGLKVSSRLLKLARVVDN
ncbi:MAG: YfiR family protein [bacterium]|nr:YfiR family protein [bacterium]